MSGCHQKVSTMSVKGQRKSCAKAVKSTEGMYLRMHFAPCYSLTVIPAQDSNYFLAVQKGGERR